MNFLKLSLLLVVIFSLNACNDDDDICTQADWIGTYSGTESCVGVPEDTNVTIIASGENAILISSVTASGSLAVDPITPVGCILERTETDAGITVTLDGELDGDNLSLTLDFTSGGVTSTCVIDAVRDN